MQKLIGGAGVVLALGVMVVSGLVNARYNMSLGGNVFDQGVMIAVSVFADAGKAISWIFFAASVKRRQVMAALASLLIFVACLAYAVSGSFGFVAMTRAQSTAAVVAKTDGASEVAGELKRKRQQLQDLGRTEPAAAVQKELEAVRQDKRYKASRRCTDVTVEATRLYCQGLAKREAALAKSIAAAQLEQDIGELQSKRQTQGGVVASSHGDVQGELIRLLTGVEIPQIQLSIALLFVVMVESGACFLLWLSLNHAVAETTAETEDVIEKNSEATSAKTAVSKVAIEVPPLLKAPGDLVTFLDERLQLVAGAATPLSAIVQAYVSWCALRDAPPLPETVLLEDLDRFCSIGQIVQQETSTGKLLLDVALIEDVLPMEMTSPAEVGRAVPG